MSNELVIRPATPADLSELWQGIFVDPKWKAFDAPYLPLEEISEEEFETGLFKRFLRGDDARVIECSGRIVGGVTCFWESVETRWLDIGITIYSPKDWGQGLGRRALVDWTTHLFQLHDVQRIGLSTWSGNPRMIASAKSVGYKVEGVLRKARYFDGNYYDSIIMGVLIDEWREQEVNHEH